MDWISVETRLPETGDYVLAYFNHGDSEYRETYTWDDKFWKMNDITHWMPLPKPPEE